MFDDVDNEKLIERFKKFHNEHNQIYSEFRKKAFEIRRKRNKYSHWAVMQAVRWESDVQGGTDFKISNDYISLYARMLVHFEPSLKGFFSFKSMKSKSARISQKEYNRLVGYDGR